MAESSTAIVAASTSIAVPQSLTGQQIVDALLAYRDVQTALDKAMPDCIIDVDGRAFRKKAYWRAIAVAFNLDVEVVDEHREATGTFADGHDNVGYVVTCRASTKSGRSVTGDGSCFAIEKASRRLAADARWRDYPAQATEHNLRAHAHTRAFNRAVSNLVGFGEVSAEEIEHDDEHVAPPSSTRRGVGKSRRPISDGQRKRLWAIARDAGWTEPEVRAYLLRAHQIESTDEITSDNYDQICDALQHGVDAPSSTEVSS